MIIEENPLCDEVDSREEPGLDAVLRAVSGAPIVRPHRLAQWLPQALTETSHPSSVPRGEAPSVGGVIDGRYRLDEVLGEGGMGVVFAATHLATGRGVALKWMRPAGGAASEAERVAASRRFVREARAAGRIVHPHVVEVLDAGTDPAAPYMVMERLCGETLRARIERGPMSWEEALSLLLPVLEGVGEAHRCGVVHRDLKPDNVFLALDDGQLAPKVLDFGISRIYCEGDSTQEPPLTRTGMAIGTPAYMPIEQLRAQAPVDVRADIYALGVVLYEMLSGTRPYAARNAADYAVLLASQPPTPLSQHRPDLRGRREAAVMRALRREPVDRYPSVEAFALALRGASARPSLALLGGGILASALCVALSVLALRAEPRATHPSAAPAEKLPPQVAALPEAPPESGPAPTAEQRSEPALKVEARVEPPAPRAKMSEAASERPARSTRPARQAQNRATADDRAQGTEMRKASRRPASLRSDDFFPSPQTGRPAEPALSPAAPAAPPTELDLAQF